MPIGFSGTGENVGIGVAGCEIGESDPIDSVGLSRLRGRYGEEFESRDGIIVFCSLS